MPSSLSQSSKIDYIDNLKVFLTALVIVHHALVTYGGPGSWYYSEKTTEMLPLIIMTMIVATNQAFFMGFFFLISALFTESSYLKKGRVDFFKDRLIRLGIPLLFYSFLLGPVMNYGVSVFDKGYEGSFFEYLRYYDDWIDFGVLWFVGALLVFTLVFDLIKKKSRPEVTNQNSTFPSNSKIIAFSLALGVASFIVRIIFPVGWVLHPIGWQLGHFPQYITMFFIGILATRSKWLNALSWKQGKKLMVLPILMIVVGFPLIYVLKEMTHSELSTFSGGLHWQSLFYSIWEQITGISIIVSLLCFGKEKWNYTSDFLTGSSRSAFAVYIFHPFFLIGTSLVLKNIAIDPVYKLLISIPVAVTVTFLFGRLIVRVPVVRKVI